MNSSLKALFSIAFPSHPPKQPMASLRNLPVELHYQVLFYLVDIVDQIAAANTCPLWVKSLERRDFLRIDIKLYQDAPQDSHRFTSFCYFPVIARSAAPPETARWKLMESDF
ncbi:hypothetical protein EYR41_007769 [Orbilia oligospora]|uniref:Uncharacterized protein n=1 Tax=Orbilia oligospora TaxID=2813651 RepID=A0A7C8KAL8_ORBOL|nr:hypothetical protein TWF751_008941 [Orbilia oligospora]TGJ66118.1 hypothetical protein EYR41_007769 [Orbilia oligospora]